MNFPYTRHSTPAVSSSSSVHPRHLPTTVSVHDWNDFLGSRTWLIRPLPVFSCLLV
jgi:hypothetical protein